MRLRAAGLAGPKMNTTRNLARLGLRILGQLTTPSHGRAKAAGGRAPRHELTCSPCAWGRQALQKFAEAAACARSCWRQWWAAGDNTRTDCPDAPEYLKD